MPKSKRTKIMQKYLNESKKLIKKLNKTIKNKSSLKKCEDFCKNDYMIKSRETTKKICDKNNLSCPLPTKLENEYSYNTCKKTFCNEKCDGYDFFGDKQQQINFKKKIKNGFKSLYSKDKVKMLKKKGAMSGCVYIDFV